jgi:hypothetical protein
VVREQTWTTESRSAVAQRPETGYAEVGSRGISRFLHTNFGTVS